ncbi:hypothetical protein OS493_012427 [Desmophyllum pertusum]|uniref:Uncharacterized protein n=1 Tax=Desmophyllum pertusum TaxID=174260 RepID=A0A9W9ZQJ6_9CNID|nr:hypothetical protein OS493_012427 [Desmophyllum pertusum]
MAFPIGSSISSRRMVMPRAPLFQDPSAWELVPCTSVCEKKGCRCSNIINLPANKTMQLVMMSDIFGGLQKGTDFGSKESVSLSRDAASVRGNEVNFNVSYEDHPTVPQGFPTCRSFDIGHDEFRNNLEGSKKRLENCGKRVSANEKQEEVKEKVLLSYVLSAITVALVPSAYCCKLSYSCCWSNFINAVHPGMKRK